MRGTLSKMSKLAGGTALALALNACVVADYGTSPGYASPRPSSSYEPRRAPVFNDAYYTIDQADGFASAIGSSPPDYSFRYGRNDAWMWNGVRGESLIMESGQRGDVQYYFQPRGSLPYLIRDEDDISYGFDRGYLVAVFGPDGTIIADGSKASDRDYAEQLLGRARELLFASQRRGWDSRSARSWSSSFGIDFILNSGWGGGWRGQPGWNPYSRYDDDYYYWRQQEWHRRHDHGDRYRDWYRRGGRNAPPVYAPPVYTETPHTRPVLGDRAGPIMDAGGRDGPREGYSGGGRGGDNVIGLPPALIPPAGVIPPANVPPQIAIDPPTIEDPRVSEEPPRRRPRPVPGEGVMERVRPQNEVISVDPQPDAMPTDTARERQAVEDQQLRAEEGRVRAEMERSRQQGLEQAGRVERERGARDAAQAQYEQSRAWEEQRRIEERGRQEAEQERQRQANDAELRRHAAPQAEQPRYEAPRYQAQRVETPPPPPPQATQPPPPQVAPPPPQVDTPPPSPPPPQQRHPRPQRVDDGNERPD
ncbi:MAG: hypothetical protein AABZ45_01770 [Pseudomonadota bacterium]